METEKKFYVYVDYRRDDGKPFYVGKGSEGRVKDLERNSLHTNIKKKHGIIREVVFETYSEQESFEKEIQLIGELQTHIDHGNGGANLTLGGEGCGWMSNQSKEKLRCSVKKLWLNEEFREKTINSMCEAQKKTWDNRDFETRKKHKESIKKSWEDPEHRESTIKSMKRAANKPERKNATSGITKKQWEDPEHRKKVSESHKKRWEDPEHKEKMSESRKKQWEDPEHRKKLKESMEKVYNDPVVRKKMSESRKKLWEDPEYRAMMKEKQRLGREKKKLEKLQQED